MGSPAPGRGACCHPSRVWQQFCVFRQVLWLLTVGGRSVPVTLLRSEERSLSLLCAGESFESR